MGLWLPFILVAYGSLRDGRAQMNLLTLAESQQILEKLTVFQLSEGRGECPGFDVAADQAPERFTLQLRGFCPPEGFAGSTLIGNFAVDRTTGKLLNWVSGKPEDSAPEVDGLARALVVQARARALSASEAECVARRVASDDLPIRDALTVVRRDWNPGRPVEFDIRHPLDTPSGMTEWTVAVDAGVPAVFFGPYEAVPSVAVTELLSWLRETRVTPALSIPESIEVAAKVPGVTVLLPGSCSKLLASAFGTSRKRFITIEDTCQAYPRSLRVVAAVDVLTGNVTAPGTRMVMDSPASMALAQEFLRRAAVRIAEARANIERVCRVK